MTAPTPLAAVQAEFHGGRRYLAACTLGLPARATLAALRADLDLAEFGRVSAADYSAVAERARGHYARLVRVAPSAVAIGSQTSVMMSLLATALPDGAEVLCAAGEFSSVVLPFVHANRSLRVREVPLGQLAASITSRTAMVAFSLVQSATGDIADAAAIRSAAREAGALTVCDTTQAVGWLPVTASEYDATVCHSYKWLCSPRGVAFLTVGEELARRLSPVHAGWYSGEDPWSSCYGASAQLASDARRFDVSPAWQAFVGAEPALDLFAGADGEKLHAYTAGLADAFRARLDLPPSQSAIVTWNDPDGVDLGRLTAAGIVASGRAGRARVAFHVFNDEADVDDAARALGR
jgi:selenocysteine lyase/cysteine desulfurase